MHTLTIEPLDSTLGAVVTGVRLGALTPEQWNAIHAAFLEHAVLVFPDQHLTDEEQIAFGRRFGALEKISERVGLTPISNIKSDGSLLDPASPVMGIIRGNEGWHTDSSYNPVSAKASMLTARVVPDDGGNTEWADMRAAYDALPEPTKARIASLSAYHSFVYSQNRAGYTGAGLGYADPTGREDPLRPLVKHHPETGRPALFIGRHAFGIPGLEAAESETLLDELMAFACQPPRIYSHRWRVGDLVVWDNRCVLHRARPWNFEQSRVMVHTRVSGDPATEAAQQTEVSVC